MPQMASMAVSSALECDLPVAKRMLTDVRDVNIYADKMYKCTEWNATM